MLIDFGSRMYDPAIGIWTTPGSFAGLDRSLNAYAYCANEPVNKFDPDGNFVGTILDLFFLGADISSLLKNLAEGNKQAALEDLMSLSADVISAAVPILPAGAGVSVRAARGVDNLVGVEKDLAQFSRTGEFGIDTYNALRQKVAG